jgi:uncharacterized membrane protein YfcA
MAKQQDEKSLLFIAIGIIVFSILAVIFLIANIQPLFYVSAILAILLGFYMSHSLSKPKEQPRPETRKRR